jgi:predicted DNA-binding transcriptional regulator YafY
MEELSISRSTAFRDLKALREAGIPYTFAQGKGYQINSTFFLPPVNLQASEAHALILLLRCAASQVDSQITAQAVRAIRKLTCGLSVPVREVCRAILEQVTVLSPQSELAGHHVDHLSLLLDAIDKKQCVEGMLLTREGGKREVRLHPHHLICAECQWLLVATVHPGAAVRTLPLGKITGLRATQKPFRSNGFNLHLYLGKAWQWQPEGQIYRVVLHIDAEHASTFTSVKWHHTQDYRMLCDGQCEMMFEVDGLEEIADWIWKHYDMMTVSKPPELKQLLVARCEALQSRLK